MGSDPAHLSVSSSPNRIQGSTLYREDDVIAYSNSYGPFVDGCALRYKGYVDSSSNNCSYTYLSLSKHVEAFGDQNGVSGRYYGGVAWVRGTSTNRLVLYILDDGSKTQDVSTKSNWPTGTVLYFRWYESSGIWFCVVSEGDYDDGSPSVVYETLSLSGFTSFSLEYIHGGGFGGSAGGNFDPYTQDAEIDSDGSDVSYSAPHMRRRRAG